jgi:hypothetical protein
VKRFSSKLEERIAYLLTMLNIPFERQKFIGGKSFDFCIQNNYILEVNGDFWHANPLLYTEECILNYPDRTVLAKDIWEKDRCKKKLAEKYGYVVDYIWEYDINAMDDEKLSIHLLDRINMIGY